MNSQEYNQAFQAFQAGRITETEWRAIVEAYWLKNMQECLPVFKRLADR